MWHCVHTHITHSLANNKTQGSHSFTNKKIPGLFQDFPSPPWKIFQDLFGAHKCLNIKKKWHLLTYLLRVQSIAENSAWSKMWTLAVQNSDELIYIWSLYTCSYFPWLSRTSSFNFQDFPGPGIFKKKNPGLSRTLQEAWEPWKQLFNFRQNPRPGAMFTGVHLGYSTQIWSIRQFCWLSGGTKWPRSAAVPLRNHYSYVIASCCCKVKVFQHHITNQTRTVSG